jgi:hypothetical protein
MKGSIGAGSHDVHRFWCVPRAKDEATHQVE